MRPSRFQIAKTDILNYFASLAQSVFTMRDLTQILDQQRSSWRLTQSMTTPQFVAEMSKRGHLKGATFRLHDGREIHRFIFGEASVYEVALSLRPRSYLCHYTALALQELTEQVPKTIYVNAEQPPKTERPPHLTQQGIDSAFAKPMRVTGNFVTYAGHTLCLLESKYTAQAGVVEVALDGSKSPLRLTDVERTLIDCAVRPLYAGGVEQILRAFEMAKGRVSVNKIAALLRKLAFIYPYHQAIGFYLERANYAETSLKLLEKFDQRFDFYLTYQMKDMTYSKRWRLWFPKSLE